MKHLAANSSWIFLLLLLALLAVGSTGCGSIESENTSARPWNSPAKWETGGIPSSMTEGR